MKKVDLLSKTEIAQGMESPVHWLRAVKKYGCYLWSVALCSLGTGVLWVLSPEPDSMNLFGAFICWVGLLLWPTGVAILVAQEWKQFRADKTGHVYTPCFDVVLVAVFSAYALYRCLFLAEPDAVMRYAQGDTSNVQSWLIALFLFLAACVIGAYSQAYRKSKIVASEEEYQEFKRLAKAQTPDEGKKNNGF